MVTLVWKANEISTSEVNRADNKIEMMDMIEEKLLKMEYLSLLPEGAHLIYENVYIHYLFSQKY